MTHKQPRTRTEAAAPEATKHLSEPQKEALDTEAEATYATGKQRERLTRKMEKSGNAAKPVSD